MKPNDWWGEPQTEVGFPSPQEFLGNARGRRTIAISLRAKDKKTET